MPAWDIYNRELLIKGYGHAVWDGDPGPDLAVDIADVGYMEEGAFVRLFNASKDIGDVSNKFGTPDGYKPLRIGAVKEGTLSASLPITSETVLQRKIGVNLSGGPIVQSGAGFVFECTKEEGAVLVLGEDADRRNALQKTSFIRYVLENYSTWLKFANQTHERGVSLDQLLLVTGCDRTSAWACAAFSASSNKLGLEFHVGNVGVPQGGISVWGSWNNCQSVQVHSGPRTSQRQISDSHLWTKEVEAADMLSRDNKTKDGLLSTVDGVSKGIAVGHVVQLLDAVNVGEDSAIHPLEGELCSATPALPNVLVSGIVLFSYVVGRLLFCICSHVISFASGGSMSRSMQPPLVLSDVVGRSHVPENPSPNIDDGHSSREHKFAENTASSPTTSPKLPSPSTRNQCVFLRGFKLCDRSTMKRRMRLLGRKKAPPEDGFTHLVRKKKDDKEDPGRSRGPSTNTSSYSFGDRESTSGHSGSTGDDSSTGSTSQSQYGSHYSSGPYFPASEPDALNLSDTQSDHEFAFYQQCRQLKQPTHLDILMEYILENSSAELALVHHDDLAMLLEHVTSMSLFESVLCQLAPTIFVENGVGMLENTFKASQDTKLTKDVALHFTPNTMKQVPSLELGRIFGTSFDPMDLKLMEKVLSFVRTELTLGGVEKLLMPLVFQAQADHLPDVFLTEDNRPNSEDGINGVAVMERTLSLFSRISRERWQHTEPMNMRTIPAANGPSFEVSKRYITEWVDAQSSGAPPAPEPPNTDVDTLSCHFVSSCFKRGKGFTALSFVLSDHSSRVELCNPSASSNISVKSSLWSSGNATGHALKRFREKVASAMGYTPVKTRSRRHLSALRKWETERGQMFGFEERFMVLVMLQDALEISRHCYPARFNRMSYKIGREVQRCLQSFSRTPQTSETTQWLIHVHVCLMSLLLSRISTLDPIMKNLAYDVLSTLTRIPISLQDHSTPAAVICLVINDLSYSQHTFQHSWLGVWLARIVELSLNVRRLNEEEVKALGVLAISRKEDRSIVRGVKCCRPWEVALFAQIATQETRFKPIVLDNYGFPSLVNALECMLADNIDRLAVHWNRVALTLRAMSFSLEQEWVAGIVKPRIISSLFLVFRRSIPEKWFCIRFWAADAIRNVVAHQPSLVQTLLQENAVAAIQTLANPKLDLGAGQSVNRRVNEIKTLVQKRLFEEYKREGLKRAAELVAYLEYVQQWTPESTPMSTLSPVTPGWSGYLDGIEEGGD